MKICLVVLCLTVAFGVAAGTITETKEDMTALGDWTIDVAAGDLNVVMVASGHYTSLPNGEGDFLTGGGEIVVRRHGLAIALQ